MLTAVSNRPGSATRLVFSGIGNMHNVRDALEELRNAMDPVKSRLWDKRWDESTAGTFPDMMVGHAGRSSCPQLGVV